MFPLFGGINDPAEQYPLLRQMVMDVQSQRATLLGEDVQRPFDVIVSGETPADQPGRAEEVIAGNAAAGATWWLESLDPQRSSGAAWSFEQLHERVLAGPLGRN